MNKYTLNVGFCTCRRDIKSVEDYLLCAPCPPPIMSYNDFRDHARNQSLETKDICIISKRCFGNSINLTNDCPPSLFVCPETTTTTVESTTKSSSNEIHIGIILGVLLPILLVLVVGACIV